MKKRWIKNACNKLLLKDEKNYLYVVMEYKSNQSTLTIELCDSIEKINLSELISLDDVSRAKTFTEMIAGGLKYHVGSDWFKFTKTRYTWVKNGRYIAILTWNYKKCYWDVQYSRPKYRTHIQLKTQEDQLKKIKKFAELLNKAMPHEYPEIEGKFRRDNKDIVF